MGLNLSAGLGGQFLTGAGIKIGIISDSFNLNTATGKENPITAGPAQADIKNGLLPSAKDIIDLAAGKAVAGGGHERAAPWRKSFMPSRPERRSSSKRRAWNRRQTTWRRLDRPSKTCKPSMSRSLSMTSGCSAGPQPRTWCRSPATRGAANRAIDAAVQSGISYFSAAGNLRLGANGIPALNIFGHNGNPHVETVAAANWLAVSSPPSLMNPYLQELTEPFSSIGTTSAKPDVTAPDGAPTSFLLPPGSPSIRSSARPRRPRRRQQWPA